MDLCLSFRDALLFYWSYFIRKVFFLWFEVKRPKVRMFLYELLYSAAKLRRRAALVPSPFDVDLVETSFGSFSVRRRTSDMSVVSPAFERRDLDRLLRMLRTMRAEGKRVLFLDVGADLGTFAVSVGNRFKADPGLRIMAFEPAPSSFAFLEENIRLNGLGRKADLCNFPLYSEDGRAMALRFDASSPGVSALSHARGGRGEVVTRTLDSVLGPKAADYDVLVLKLDVEGAERHVLEGGGKTLSDASEVCLLVEDFVEPSIMDYLAEKGFRPVAKLTPYNSFWLKRHE
jgi:FkbM family methyltransferase